MVKASIVIPAFNEAGYLEKTLRAALHQDFTEPYEIIVVDNASDDGTGDIARRFPTVRVIREEQKGLPFAREAGRKAAHGEIIVQLDADSIPNRQWLSRGIQHFTSPGIICASGPYYYYDGGVIFRWFFYLYCSSVVVALNSLLGVRHKGGVVFGGNLFVRAAALEAIGGYDTSILFYGEDVDVARRLGRIGRIKYSPLLYIHSSARRFKRMGTIRLFWRYSANFISVLAWGKPYHNDVLY